MFNNTVFHAITLGLKLGCVHNALENEKSLALLRFHALTGCDLRERFRGFSETTCFKTFESNSFVHKVFASLGKTRMV